MPCAHVPMASPTNGIRMHASEFGVSLTWYRVRKIFPASRMDIDDIISEIWMIRMMIGSIPFRKSAAFLLCNLPEGTYN